LPAFRPETVRHIPGKRRRRLPGRASLVEQGLYQRRKDRADQIFSKKTNIYIQNPTGDAERRIIGGSTFFTTCKRRGARESVWRIAKEGGRTEAGWKKGTAFERRSDGIEASRRGADR
jgi:hypothetical protein